MQNGFGLLLSCWILHGFLSTDILQGNFKPDFYLKYIQKDLRLAIALGDSVNHPTPMAAAANEVYKRAKALDQSDNDMSAVYRAYIH